METHNPNYLDEMQQKPNKLYTAPNFLAFFYIKQNSNLQVLFPVM